MVQTDFMALARHAYEYAEEHYGDKDARFDVIVECMGKSEIADELREAGIHDYVAAVEWTKKRAGLHFEQELNQAWDGPESVKSSSRYDPAHDPAGPLETPEQRMVAEITALSPSLGEWAAQQVSYGATCAELVAKLREAAAKVGRS